MFANFSAKSLGIRVPVAGNTVDDQLTDPTDQQAAINGPIGHPPPALGNTVDSKPTDPTRRTSRLPSMVPSVTHCLCPSTRVGNTIDDQLTDPTDQQAVINGSIGYPPPALGDTIDRQPTDPN